jgi:hypothetical protein
MSVNLQREQIRDCYERISDRAKVVLNEKQYVSYQEFQKRSTALTQGGVREVRWGRTEPFYRWLIDFYFFVILPLNCVRACGGLIRDELQADTLGFLTTRPLSRPIAHRQYLAQTARQIMLGSGLAPLRGRWPATHPKHALCSRCSVAQFLAVMAWSAWGYSWGNDQRYMYSALYGLVVELASVNPNQHQQSLSPSVKSCWLTMQPQGITVGSPKGCLTPAPWFSRLHLSSRQHCCLRAGNTIIRSRCRRVGTGESGGMHESDWMK